MDDDIRAEIERTVRAELGEDAMDAPSPDGEEAIPRLPDIITTTFGEDNDLENIPFPPDAVAEQPTAAQEEPVEFPLVAVPPAKVREASPPPPQRKSAVGACFFLLLGVLVYGLLVGNMISRAFVDIGDGNYLYTAARMADGLTIYKDFLSPQPPMHLLTGELLIRAGRQFDNPDAPLYAVRIFSLILHVLTMGWIFLLARRIGRSAWTGAIAAVIYLFAPLGFWWSLGYQSELQELFWMFGALYLYIRFSPRSMFAAGVMTGLSVLTNMTAAPYAVAALAYLLVRHGTPLGNPNRRHGWSLIWAFLVPLVAVVGGVSAYYEKTTGAFFQNVIFNQVGSYPTESFAAFFAYAQSKVLGQGQKILVYDGGFLVLGLLGLLLYNRTERRAEEREYVVWYALALLLSVLYVTKGGTMDYIFCIGEPVLAIFGAYFLTHSMVWHKYSRFFRQPLWRDTSFFPQMAVLALLGVVVLAFPIRFWVQVVRGEQFEQTEEALDRVLYYMDEYSKPGDTILAPPYYAFVSHRLLAREYSELFLWRMKYDNEIWAFLPKRADLLDPSALLARLAAGRDPVSRKLMQYFQSETQLTIVNLKSGDLLSNDLLEQLIKGLGAAVRSRDFFDPREFAGIALPEQVAVLASQNPLGSDLWRMNRLALDAACSGVIVPSVAAQEPDGEGVTEVKALAALLRKKAIPLVIADPTPFSLLLHSEEIRQAVEAHYDPQISEEHAPLFRTMNYQMQIYVPKDDGAKR